MYEYALLLLDGEKYGISNEQIVKEVPFHFKSAADKGNIDAMIGYGYIKFTGNGAQMDMQEGSKYFKMAISKGSLNAVVKYSMVLKNEEDPEFKKENKKLVNVAADNGHDESMCNYAVLLVSNPKSMDDYQMAAKYFKEAADQNNIQAICSFACLLKSGVGVEKNMKEACRYYKMAADQGSSEGIKGYNRLLKEGVDNSS